MSGRRILALLAAAVWLAPSALVAGLALHVALEHDRPAGPSRHLAPSAVAALAEHGHAHANGADEHEHASAVPEAPAVRRGAGPVAVAPSVGAIESAVGGSAALAAVAAPPPAPPPRAAGPPLLALLSILRV